MIAYVFFISTWPASLQTSISDSSGFGVSVDLLFMSANTNFLSKKWQVGWDKFIFSQWKITLEVLKLLLSWLIFFFFSFFFFPDLLWLHIIEYKSRSNRHLELSLAVQLSDSNSFLKYTSKKSCLPDFP